MGVDVARVSHEARDLLDQASAACGVDLAKAIVRGTSALRRTAVLQPALVAVQLGYFAWLAARGIDAAFTAGHSLGEISAWSAAGAIASADAVDLAAQRGALMERAATAAPGGMLALVGADVARRHEALAIGAAHGRVSVAAENADDECVLSGDFAALAAIRRAIPEARPVPVSGPWHSVAMASVREPWRNALASVPIAAARCEVVSSVTGTAERSSDACRDALAFALEQPVRWTACLDALAARGVRDVVIVGPGKALRALVRRHRAVFEVRVVDEV
jgi:[acyl-carrier-protein] S-malonyltransferase